MRGPEQRLYLADNKVPGLLPQLAPDYGTFLEILKIGGTVQNVAKDSDNHVTSKATQLILSVVLVDYKVVSETQKTIVEKNMKPAVD